MTSLPAAYTHGTHRLCPPDQTLARITPYLKTCGITRCAEVTGLDIDLGVPTYCAIRPTGLVLQTSNGKGLTPLSARVSALMEAIELYHAENPEHQQFRRVSLNIISQNKPPVIEPQKLAAFNNTYFSNDFMIDWLEGENLISQKGVWLPASAVYFWEPSLYRTSTNGLASGNHPVEATLHALYELIERDAISSIEVNGRLKIKEKCRAIDPATISNDTLQQIIQKLEAAESKLVLLWVQSCIPIHTFWAVLLNKSPFGAVSTFNAGYGSHFDINVAAARAITEAIQSRLTMIHGSREDIIAKPVYKADEPETSRAFAYFDNLKSDTTWQAIEAQVTYKNDDLEQNYQYILHKMSEAGYNQIIRVDLTKPAMNIPVVKVIIPSLRFNRKLF